MGAQTAATVPDKTSQSERMPRLVTTISNKLGSAQTLAKSVNRYRPVPKIMLLAW